MVIIGIYDDHNCSAALSIDGKIEFAAQEERFTRNKNEVGYPKHCVDYILKQYRLAPGDIDEIARATIDRTDYKEFKFKRSLIFTVRDHIDFMDNYWKPKLAGEPFDSKYLDKLCERDKRFHVDSFYNFPASLDDLPAEELNDEILKITQRDISRHTGVAEDKIRFYDHHACHVYYAYYANPHRKDRTIGVTVDAFGDGRNQTVWNIENDVFTLLADSSQCELARLYRMITLYLGMKPQEHEYKVMGLAPYAKADYLQDVLKEFEGLQQFDGLRMIHKDRPKNLFRFLQERLKYYRFDNIAAAVQVYVETWLAELFRKAHEQTGCRNFVFGGGVAMNVKANKLIGNLECVDDLFVAGSSSDECLSIGACYLAGRSKNISNQPLPTLYLGPEYDNEALAAFDRQHDLAKVYDIVPNVKNSRIAELLASGEVVARFAGRMEFGARALGNRSIMANPSRTDVIKTINEMIKGRDFWMPFAATVLDKHASKYLDNPRGYESRYMAIAMETKKQHLAEIKAGTHPYDETIRPQILSRDMNPGYYDIIDEFCELTGIGAILNTSFNLHGYPIVLDIKDAFDVFANSGLSHLIVNTTLFSKKGRRA